MADRTISDLFRENRERRQSAHAALTLLRSTGQLARRADLVYRCPGPKHCIVARVYETPGGVLIWTPGYVLSPRANSARSVAAAREKYTSDDDGRRWNESAFYLDQAANVPINCSHCLDSYLPTERVLADIASHRKRITLQRVGFVEFHDRL